MKCVLCEEEIKDYDPQFNLLKVGDDRSAAMCPECIKKFLKWQQELFVKLYPTTRAKKWIKKNNL